MFEKLIIRIVLISFFFISIGPIPNASAQAVIGLPAPGTMVDFSPKFNQATLKGIVFYHQNPFKFDFILDEGDTQLNDEQSREQSQKIAAYFLASLTTPEKEIWVNLSPYEKRRIVPTSFGDTLMGQNLLAQDYILKQIMATALYPERQLGKEFWQKVYTQAIITKMNAVFVAKSTLKVLLEKDYLASERNQRQPGDMLNAPPVMESVANTMSAAVIKELVIPALEKEVNEGKNFAPLRQVYNALILAKWYKDHLKNNVISKGYVDRNKIAGVESQDKQMVSDIYHLYLKAYRKGVFNYIKEDFDEASQSLVPRKYFSGGFMGAVHVTTCKAMTAGGFKRTFIASILLAFATSTAVPSASAQQSPPLTPQQAVSGVIGFQTESPTTALTAEQKSSLLMVIKNAVNGGGDPVAAAGAFQQISDTSAVEYAAGILRLSSGGSWDKPLSNLLSNSSGPGIIGGLSPLVSMTNLGLAQSLGEITKTIRERRNVGMSTLRLEAAFYLMRVADQIKNNSTPLQKLSKRGTWESLNTKNETDDTVKAARLLAQAVLIRVGIESRTLGGGTAIVGLEQIEEELKSSDWMVRYAALTVLDAIKLGDPDNRYQGIIARFLQDPADKITDIEMYEMAVSIAVKHGMVTVLPGIMQNMERFSKARPSDIVALRNWHTHMQAVMQMAIQLSNGNKDLLIANLDAMSGRLTESGATDTVNSLYLGFLFASVQSGDLTLADFVDQLNKLRTMYGLSKVPVSGIQIGPQARDAGEFLVQLKAGTNVDQNVLNIVLQGGPMYFPDLLAVFKETNDIATMKAILGRIDAISSMGVYSLSNPWTTAIGEKLNDPNRVVMIGALQGLSASGSTPKYLIPTLVRAAMLQKNPDLDTTQTGQKETFNRTITLFAQVIVNSKIGDPELWLLIDDATSSAETDPLTGKQLEQVVTAIREGTNPQQAGKPDWVSAEKLLLSYLRDEDGVTPLQVAQALEAAYQIYRSPADPNSGDMIMRKIIAEYPNPADRIKLAQVFMSFKDKDFGFELLSDLLGSHSLQLDKTVLKFFQQASPKQVKRAAPQILDAYIYWLDKQSLNNVYSRNVQLEMGGLVRKLGSGHALMDAVRDRLPSASDDALPILQGLLGGSAPRTSLPATSSPTASSSLAPSSVRPSSSPSVSSAGISYEAGLTIILNPNVSPAKLEDTLNRMANINSFPSYALNQLTNILDTSSTFKQQEYRVLLLNVIAKAHGQLQGVIVGMGPNQELRDRYLDAFRKAPDGLSQTTALNLFMNAPNEIAGDLFWESINILRDKDHYPDIAKDPQQAKEYFRVLMAIRWSIQHLPSDKYTAVVSYMQSKLLAESVHKRYEINMQHAFLQSMGAAGNDFGIQNVPGTDHFLHAPAKSSWLFNQIDDRNGKIIQSYTDLAGRLNSIIPQIPAVPAKVDLLVELRNLYNFSNPSGQMAAIPRLGGVILFLQNELLSSPELDSDVRTILLYYGNNFHVSGDVKITMPQDTSSFSNQDWILYMGQLAKRGAWDLARQYLLNENLFAQHPEALSELIFQIGQQGGSDMVDPLLQFYVTRHLTANYLGFGKRVNSNYAGEKVEDALISMGKRDKGVKPKLARFKYNLPVYAQNWANAGPVIQTIINEIPDKAMTNGGIDLEDVNVRSQGTADIQTAFDDQAQLSILIKSDGLIPVIVSVKLLSQPAIDQLIGLL